MTLFRPGTAQTDPIGRRRAPFFALLPMSPPALPFGCNHPEVKHLQSRQTVIPVVDVYGPRQPRLLLQN
jgi:hypothetical protein